MSGLKKELWLHRLFFIVIIGRGLYGTFEMILGFTLLLTTSVAQLAHILVQGELLEDPTDIVALSIDHAASALAVGSLTFVVTYLIFYGVLKIFLTICLLWEKRWAYPAAIILSSIFLAYQLYRITETHSFTLAVITIADILTMALIAHEYYHTRKHSEA